MFDFLNVPLPDTYWVWLAAARFAQFCALTTVTHGLIKHRVHILALLPFLGSLSYFGTQLFLSQHSYNAGTPGLVIINILGAAGYFVIAHLLDKLLIKVNDARVERLMLRLIHFLKER